MAIIPQSAVAPAAGHRPGTDFWHPQVVQFFTSRGYTVVDLDYRGTTGYDYGRGYRNGQWGVLDLAGGTMDARWRW